MQHILCLQTLGLSALTGLPVAPAAAQTPCAQGVQHFTATLTAREGGEYRLTKILFSGWKDIACCGTKGHYCVNCDRARKPEDSKLSSVIPCLKFLGGSSAQQSFAISSSTSVCFLLGPRQTHIQYSSIHRLLHLFIKGVLRLQCAFTSWEMQVGCYASCTALLHQHSNAGSIEYTAESRLENFWHLFFVPKTIWLKNKSLLHPYLLWANLHPSTEDNIVYII